MATKKFTQQEAEGMYKLLNDIHSSLKDRNQNKRIKKIPFIEIAWIAGIENFLPKQKHLIKGRLKTFNDKL